MGKGDLRAVRGGKSHPSVYMSTNEMVPQLYEKMAATCANNNSGQWWKGNQTLLVISAVP